ncbi:MAG TPA: metalloregulator ArsR/SmtB family transcription factor [Tepidisphaeraceae bacterium]|jgi:DNA-binding transcriptional ArsR family regulator|nr:metalloregulator ArsR/SmtB family transcription factor [Tepidisphaeraceae bacterium]
MVKSSRRRHTPLDGPQLAAVADLFAVLSEPSRLRILQFLQGGPATVSQIMKATGLKQANASKQLGILHQAGVLAREKDGNVVNYSIRLPLVFDLCALVCTGLREEAHHRLQQLKG